MGSTKTLYSFFDFSIKRNMTNSSSNVYTTNLFFYTSYYYIMTINLMIDTQQFIMNFDRSFS
ncbi:uncharacterized protein DS421_3g84370 [Arachis hypogaea]|nr:uncharacterized protein DS421_3g84370 [Arachis hypogaea]